MRGGLTAGQVLCLALAATAALPAQSAPARPTPGGYVIEHDADVAQTEPGTHNGGGETVGYSFFAKTPNLSLVFRKRAHLRIS